MLEMQPIEYMSSGIGSSLAADFCATRRMLLPASMAISIALIDFGRPTKSGITMCGKTTTSLRGSSGNWTGMAESSLADIVLPLDRVILQSEGRSPDIQAACADAGAAFTAGFRATRQPSADPSR